MKEFSKQIPVRIRIRSGHYLLGGILNRIQLIQLDEVLTITGQSLISDEFLLGEDA